MTDDKLDSEIALFVARLGAAWREHPPLETMSVAEARVAAEQVRAPWREGGPAMRETREGEAPGPDGVIRYRAYRPEGVAAADAPVLVYLHGGGFVFFSLDTHDRLMREYAAGAGCVVIGVDYPLSPEHRYPIALEQIVAFVRWLGNQGKSLGIDPTRVAIGGDSVGGALSLATGLTLRDAGEGERLRAILFNYGAFSGEVSDAAEAALGGPDALLNRAEMTHYYGSYLRGAADAADPRAVPLLERDLAGLPPAMFVIPDCDVLAEQSDEVAARMAAAGVPVTVRHYRGATHSFLEAMSIAAIARQAIADACAWLERCLAK